MVSKNMGEGRHATGRHDLRRNWAAYSHTSRNKCALSSQEPQEGHYPCSRHWLSLHLEGEVHLENKEIEEERVKHRH
jgi:hypothetical protein